MHDLIPRLRTAAVRIPTLGGPSRPRAPITEKELEAFETRTGRVLPTFWCEVLREIGNGGFGPGYGITGLITGAVDDQGMHALHLYELLRQPDPEDPRWGWPEHLLPIAHWGCAIQSCIDLTDPSARMIRFDPNGHGPDEGWECAWWLEAETSETWWAAWLEGRLSFEHGAV
jgi:hypothetical protein